LLFESREPAAILVIGYFDNLCLKIAIFFVLLFGCRELFDCLNSGIRFHQVNLHDLKLHGVFTSLSARWSLFLLAEISLAFKNFRYQGRAEVALEEKKDEKI
jgi:hypothetical protein